MDFSSSPHKPPILHSSSSSWREHMFEKVVTTSDAGKLNRLVIPKQHAEKYFPLDSAAGEKGLLLNFDETSAIGKSWRFRYSYWRSSHNYVITKGWSRFVKDKQLFADDVCVEIVEIYPGNMKIDLVVNEFEFELDSWRFRLSESTRPKLAVARCSDGDLVVTVPKIREEDEDFGVLICFGDF